MPEITIVINGEPKKADAAPGESLLELLRGPWDLTGAKYGCGEGQCGACTVLLEGRAVKACITPARLASGKRVTTIEGLARNGRLHPVQEAFLETQAFQCGFCTPGLIMGAAALLETKPKATEAEIRQALDGHICRCGTYPRIVQAVRLASARLQKEGRRG